LGLATSADEEYQGSSGFPSLAGRWDEMASQTPEYRHESARTYDDRRDTMIALLGAVLLGAAIIGLFMFITWFAYAVD